MTREEWYELHQEISIKFEKKEYDEFLEKLWRMWILNSCECAICKKRVFEMDVRPIEDESSPLKYICIDCDKKEEK